MYSISSNVLLDCAYSCDCVKVEVLADFAWASPRERPITAIQQHPTPISKRRRVWDAILGDGATQAWCKVFKEIIRENSTAHCDAHVRGVLPTLPPETSPRAHSQSAKVRSWSGCLSKTGLSKRSWIQMRGGCFGRNLHSRRLLELPRMNLKQILSQAAVQKADTETEVVQKV